jgi:Mat/Ecp fimbriae periplasmic chaperone
MKPLIRCLLPLSLLLASQAQANLTIHPMRTSVDGKRPTQIRVYSQSTQPQYVQVSLRRIVNPAEETEHEVELDPEEAAIAVTPAKFALAGGGNRLIRIVPLRPPALETAYRVYFEGVGGPQAADMADGEGADAQVGVSLVWGALVNVLPAESRVELRVDSGTLLNLGTARVGITSVADCVGSRCTAHDISRALYPGGVLNLPFDVRPGHTVQLRYRLTRDGHREHVQTLIPAAI